MHGFEFNKDMPEWNQIPMSVDGQVLASQCLLELPDSGGADKRKLQYPKDPVSNPGSGAKYPAFSWKDGESCADDPGESCGEPPAKRPRKFGCPHIVKYKMPPWRVHESWLSPCPPGKRRRFF